ncbi:nuclear polyadenylated RNA-binding protein 3 [Exophiala xenobiotica]|nr:nuclear polyadenylated RNA-binding protein 3 [Exophiala xenobiotica]KAK5210393.1 nuclear polyadenylated RNA-binding protein 3 [Exophiala xenobiotica]KAK5228393.1 nuclear polyadenylated RNA-binding protein 3 [Exophiala xenobiotica]KAK5302171.1 nuclear polyadenylated RNA-binding protein 3 [Exophiala xenobiotica]KAK5450896.1 nuclear polyadenylated RNA-binding protein 3 [Exophiala xenobiotica]
MSETNPPPEAQRFGRSQTPESPRPVHLPEPSNIPVLLNQMDPVFNDTATYNIPHNQNLSPYSDPARNMTETNSDEQDAVQNFLRGAEEENVRFESAPDTNGQNTQNDAAGDSTLLSALANNSTYQHASAQQPHDPPSASSQTQAGPQFGNDVGVETTTAHTNANEANVVHLSGAENISEPLNSDGRPAQGGVDYQSLLDTISQSASTAPAAEPVSAPTTAASFIDPGTQILPLVPGLPPKPPANLELSDTPSYQTFPTSAAETQTPYQHVNNDAAQANSAESFVPGSAQSMIQDLASHFPPGWPQAVSQLPPQNAPPPLHGQTFQPPEPTRSTDPSERPWTPQTQSLYDQFLEDERRYVTEGIWDKFPNGSRLFVGNLPSEKVTKRDLFHTFHKHGRLAQISIKQAYGFVQFLEAPSCQAALQAEQGVEIRGRKVHLEISKPQKNTRGQGQGNKRRRSRSPDRGVQRQGDRSGRNYSEFREERHRRDDYRGRSPSPKGYRSRDDYRSVVQSPRFGPDGRPRSPYGSFPPPVPVGYDEEATLPVPRREPRDIPDVQLLILESTVAQGFINWIEQGFRAKGLRASTIWLSPRLPLNGVVKRQIIEGVQAVVKLTQGAQYNSRIPLQVFDRSAGASNVNFNEYADLDVSIAADIVLHARQKERGYTQAPQFPPPPPTPQGYAQGQYGQPAPPPQYPPQMPPSFPQQQQGQYHYGQPAPYQGQAQTPVTPTSSANLQQLLANLRQPGEPQSAASAAPPSDLAGLLSNVARQNQGGQFPQSPSGQQPQQGYGGAPVYGAGQQSQQNVQNIMDTLARYGR